MLAEQKGQITEEMMMRILRDHGAKADENYSPAKGLIQNPPCMHAGAGMIRGSQTTGSLVSHLTADTQTHWVTATSAPCTSAPCTSIFKPIWIDAGLPDLGQVPTGHYNHAALWWRHEALHRGVLRDYTTRMAVYQAERDQMEARFLAGAREHKDRPAAERAAFTVQCFNEVDEATDRWSKQVQSTPPQQKLPRLYLKVWEKLVKQCGYYFGFRSDYASTPGG